MEIDEKLEQFVNNQRKGNLFMLIAFIIFIGLAASTLFFATGLTKAKKELEASNKKLAQDAHMLDSLYNLASIKEQSLNNIKTYYDTLLKNKFEDDSIYFSNKQKGKFSRDSFAGKYLRYKQMRATVYIQYQPGAEMEKEKNNIFRTLSSDKNYKVPKPEMVDRSYEREIRYFNKDDQGVADKLLNILGGNFRLVWVQTIKSPLNQIEVWIGEPKMIDIQQQIKK